jgi:hypothetical protein
MAKRIAESGGQAVKLKIGGRMSRNADASPGRSEKLVALARKTWGDQFTIFRGNQVGLNEISPILDRP